MNTTLDYAWRLGNVTSAAEFIDTVDQPRAQALPTDHETCGRIHDVDAHIADERMTASVARPVVQLFWTLGKVVVVRREARRVGRPAPHGISARN